MRHLAFRLLLSSAILGFSQVASARDGASPDAWAKEWDLDCKPRGCLMFLDIAHGPFAPQEVLTITVAVNRVSRDVAFMSFIVPTTADPPSGLRIAFAALDEKGAGTPVKVTQTAILPFEECRSDGCVARVPGGVFKPSPVHPAIDLLQLFKSAHLVEFEYVVNGQAVRASTALRGFQISHEKVMNKEFGPVAPVPSRPAPAPKFQGIQTSM